MKIKKITNIGIKVPDMERETDRTKRSASGLKRKPCQNGGKKAKLIPYL